MIVVDVELAEAAGVPVRTGFSARQLLAASVVGLTGPDAWERLQHYRAGGLRAVVVVVSSVEVPSDRARLEPVVVIGGPEELPAALARATQPRIQGSVALASGIADFDRSRFVRTDGAVASLTALETRLLAYLATRPGRAVGREELQRQVWEHRKAVPTKTVDMAVARLRKKIELEPASPVTVLTVRGGGYRAVPAPAQTIRTPPLPGGRFVGRAVLLRRLSAAEAGSSQVISGPPGVGKSRLCHEVARAFPGRWRVVDLDGSAGISLATALATALGAPADGEPLEGALRALAGLSLLGIDHADEHLDELPPLIERIAGTDTRLLVMSRRSPTIPGLRVHPLSPLEPAEAASLLLDRCGDACTEEQATSLAATLDNLPLAIELAAARLPGLGATGLAEALALEGVGWLGGEGARHRTLADAIGASWSRLGSDEQDALAALTVFRGSFSLAEARRVAGSAAPVLVLVAHSLVTRDGDRFRLLHAIRDHAGAQRPGSAGAATPRYVSLMAAVAASGVAALGGFEGREAGDDLAARAADLGHAFAAATDDSEIGELVEALHWLRLRSGSLQDRVALLDQALSRTDPHSGAHARMRSRRAETIPDTRKALACAESARQGPLADPDLSATVERTVARLLTVVEGPAAALAALLAIDPAGVSPTLALRLEADILNQRLVLGELPHAETADRLFLIVEELVSLGSLLAAAEVGIHVGFHWTRSDPERAVSLLGRLSRWVEAAQDTALRVALAFPLSEGLVRLRAFDRAAALLDDTELLAERIRPASVVRLLAHRAELAAGRGQLDEVRRLQERVLAAERRWGNPHREFGALEALTVAEVESGRLEHGAQRALEAERAAAESRSPHLLHHAVLLVAWTQLLAGDLDVARSALDRLDLRHLSDFGRAQATHARVVATLLGAGPDPAAWSAFLSLDTTLPDAAWRDAMLAVGAAGRAQDTAELERWARPDEEASADIRVMARLWLATIQGHGALET